MLLALLVFRPADAIAQPAAGAHIATTSLTGDVESSLATGAAFVARGRWEEARRAFDEAVRRHPRVAIAHYNLGVTLAALDRLHEASESYRAAVRLDPRFAQGLVNLGVVLARLGRSGEGLSYLNRAVAIDPDLAAAQHNRGIVLAGMEKFDAAVAALETAAALAPRDAQARLSLADTRYDFGVYLADQHRWVAASDQYRAALRMNNAFPEAHNALAIALARTDRHEAAVKEYGAALQWSPHFAEAHYNRALSLAALGRGRAAIEDCQAALRIRPDLREAGVLLDALQRIGRSATDPEAASTIQSSFEPIEALPLRAAEAGSRQR